MEALQEVAPEVHEHFLAGESVVARSQRSFAQVSVDLALEQTINKDTKTSGGIKGFSQSSGTVQRWMTTSHYRAALLSKASTMTDLETTLMPHKEMGKARLMRDESDVRKITTELKNNVNPFSLADHLPLSNLKSGQVASTEVQEDLMTAFQKGKQSLNGFVEKRINMGEKFYEPIKRLNLKTFASMKRRNPTLDRVAKSGDRELFSRIIVIAQSRKFDLPDLFTHELTNIPLAIASTDGCIRKTDKSVLLKLLEERSQVIERSVSDLRNF